MPLQSENAAGLDFVLKVERFYAAMTEFAEPGVDGEVSLGGRLIFAGKLDAAGRALVVAGNIIGAASLSATADPAAQRQANHDGVVDFMVTSLDEALRILKNEIRKHQPVAVCVALSTEIVQREMIERGVQPNFVAASLDGLSGEHVFSGGKCEQIRAKACTENEAAVTWQVGTAPALWLPKMDRLALESLPDSAVAARRWLRLAPRYLGRLAHGVRVLTCDREVVDDFAGRVQDAISGGEISVEVSMSVVDRGETKIIPLVPGKRFNAV